MVVVGSVYRLRLSNFYGVHAQPTREHPALPPLAFSSVVQKLLTNEPNPSPATWVNLEAAEMAFSRDQDNRKQWKKKARALARRSMEE